MEQVFVEKVQAGDSEAVQRAVGADRGLAAATDENGVSMTLLALYHGHAAIAEWLADRVEELSVSEAAALGRLEALERALDADSEAADRRSPDGFPLLCLAAFFGRPAALGLLLDRGADPNRAADNPTRVRPLHSAAAHGDPEVSLTISRLLVAAGAEPNARQQGGWTPLHQAAARGRDALVALLLGAGADPAAENDEGLLAVDMARKGDHDRVVGLLSR